MVRRVFTVLGPVGVGRRRRRNRAGINPQCREEEDKAESKEEGESHEKEEEEGTGASHGQRANDMEEDEEEWSLDGKCCLMNKGWMEGSIYSRLGGGEVMGGGGWRRLQSNIICRSQIIIPRASPRVELLRAGWAARGWQAELDLRSKLFGTVLHRLRRLLSDLPIGTQKNEFIRNGS